MAGNEELCVLSNLTKIDCSMVLVVVLADDAERWIRWVTLAYCCCCYKSCC